MKFFLNSKYLEHFALTFKLMRKNNKWLLLASLFLILLQGSIPLPTLFLVKHLIDTVSQIGNPSAVPVDFDRVALIIALLALVSWLGSLASSLTRLVTEMQVQKMTEYIIQALHAKSVELDLEYYENAKYYDMLHRAQRQAAFRPARILSTLAQIGQNGISLLVVVGLLLYVEPVVTLFLLLMVSPLFLIRIKYAEKLYQLERQITRKERKASYLNSLLTDDVYAKEVRLYNSGASLQQRFRTLRKEIHQDKLGLMYSRTLREGMAESLAILATFGCIALVAYRTIQGAATLGELILYFQAFQRVQSYFQTFSHSLAVLHENGLFLSSLDEFLNLEPKIANPENPESFPRPIRRQISFENVSFSYPASERKVLENIEIVLKPGQTMALVGDNGSGKTSLIKLLCRLYDPSGGRILVDGIDLRQFDIIDFREKIAVLFQDFAKYHFTAQENISMGYGDESDLTAVEQAAQNSGADEFIAKLPKGYKTQLGKRFDEGTDLSLGQWQKVAISRALIRDAEIIILDEPTSALDPEAEFAIFNQLRRLAGERIVILISHRLSNVRIADLICVMKDGKIIEQGNHDQLMEKNGAYAHLFRLQASNYR